MKQRFGLIPCCSVTNKNRFWSALRFTALTYIITEYLHSLQRLPKTRNETCLWQCSLFVLVFIAVHFDQAYFTLPVQRKCEKVVKPWIHIHIHPARCQTARVRCMRGGVHFEPEKWISGGIHKIHQYIVQNLLKTCWVRRVRWMPKTVVEKADLLVCSKTGCRWLVSVLI